MNPKQTSPEFHLPAAFPFSVLPGPEQREQHRQNGHGITDRPDTGQMRLSEEALMWVAARPAMSRVSAPEKSSAPENASPAAVPLRSP